MWGPSTMCLCLFPPSAAQSSESSHPGAPPPRQTLPLPLITTQAAPQMCLRRLMAGLKAVSAMREQLMTNFCQASARFMGYASFGPVSCSVQSVKPVWNYAQEAAFIKKKNTRKIRSDILTYGAGNMEKVLIYPIKYSHLSTQITHMGLKLDLFWHLDSYCCGKQNVWIFVLA